MSFRSDVSIDWKVSPRIITVAAPSTTITIQDLSDTIRVLEGSRVWALTREYILDNEGKFDLGTKLTGISLRLVDAKLAFEERAGPTWAECTVTGGNLASVDSLGAAQWPIQPTPFVNATFESDTSAALLRGSIMLEGDQALWLEAAAKAVTNKAEISLDDLTVTIYDDDQITPLYEFDISADKRIRTPA